MESRAPSTSPITQMAHNENASTFESGTCDSLPLIETDSGYQSVNYSITSGRSSSRSPPHDFQPNNGEPPPNLNATITSFHQNGPETPKTRRSIDKLSAFHIASSTSSGKRCVSRSQQISDRDKTDKPLRSSTPIKFACDGRLKNRNASNLQLFNNLTSQLQSQSLSLNKRKYYEMELLPSTADRKRRRFSEGSGYAVKPARDVYSQCLDAIDEESICSNGNKVACFDQTLFTNQSMVLSPEKLDILFNVTDDMSLVSCDSKSPENGSNVSNNMCLVSDDEKIPDNSQKSLDMSIYLLSFGGNLANDPSKTPKISNDMSSVLYDSKMLEETPHRLHISDNMSIISFDDKFSADTSQRSHTLGKNTSQLIDEHINLNLEQLSNETLFLNQSIRVDPPKKSTSADPIESVHTIDAYDMLSPTNNADALEVVATPHYEHKHIFNTELRRIPSRKRIGKPKCFDALQKRCLYTEISDGPKCPQCNSSSSVMTNHQFQSNITIRRKPNNVNSVGGTHRDAGLCGNRSCGFHFCMMCLRQWHLNECGV